MATIHLSTFEEMKLNENLLKGLIEHGADKPSSMQKLFFSAIGEEKRNVLCKTPSWSRNSEVIAMGILQRVANATTTVNQVLIICARRESAIITNRMIESYGEYMKISTHCCVGGQSIKLDKEALSKGVQIITGTPGRIGDLIMRKYLNLNDVKILVLDDADILLSDFKNCGMDTIIENLHVNMQIYTLSKTISDDLKEFSKKYMNNPISIEV